MEQISPYNEKKKIYNLILLTASIQQLNNYTNTKHCFARNKTYELKEETPCKEEKCQFSAVTQRINSKAACNLEDLSLFLN